MSKTDMHSSQSNSKNEEPLDASSDHIRLNEAVIELLYVSLLSIIFPGQRVHSWNSRIRRQQSHANSVDMPTILLKSTS